MRVLIDFQGAQGFGVGRGVGRYTREFSRALFSLRNSELDLFFLVNLSIRENLSDILDYIGMFCPRDRIKGFFVPEAGCLGTDLWRKKASFIRGLKIAEVNPDLILLTSLFESVGSRIVSDSNAFKCKQAVILYDLIPFEEPEIYLTDLKERAHYDKSINQLLSSDLILTISEYTKNVFLAHFTGKGNAEIISIGSATEKKAFSPATPEKPEHSTLKKLGIDKEYILTVSGQDQRKNLKTLLLAFSKLPSILRHKHQLVIVCNMEKSVINSFLEQYDLSSYLHREIIFTGSVEEEDLENLYAHCKLFVFPSIKEGFGLPVLEAMSFGRPCLVANATSLPDLVGDAGIKFDATNFQDLSNKLVELLSDPSELMALSKLSLKKSREYSWLDVAEKAKNSIASVLSNGQKCVTATPFLAKDVSLRKKLAYISPMPPDQTGVSKYSSNLIPYLSKFYEIFFVSNSSLTASSEDKQEESFKIISREHFVESFNEYDRVLYHFGNSEFHLSYFELLKSFPGVVVLHDVFLDGVCALREDYFQILFDHHGASGNYSVFLKKNHDKPYPCSLEVIDQSIGLIVHSKHARNLLRKWYGKEVLHKCAVVPFLKESRPKPKTNTKNIEQSHDCDILICTFGYLGPGKMNLQLFEAWTRSVADRSKLVFVGTDGDDEYCAELKKKAFDSPHRDKIIFTGWVSEQDYDYWLRVATVGVQLRANSRGETSASLFDCLSNGVPVVVNSHGDMRELPDSIAFKIAENFSSFELENALTYLIEEPEFRRNLSVHARTYVEKNHLPIRCTKRYFSAVESFYTSKNPSLPVRLLDFKKSNFFENTDELNSFVGAMLKTSLPSFRPKTIFIDVSEIVLGDIRTGIQRVVRNVLRSFTENNVGYGGFRVEPVYTTHNANEYFCAGEFLANFFGLHKPFEERVIEPKSGDIFLGLDLQPILVPKKKKLLLDMQERGIRIQFVVYDLLPLTHREYFSPGIYTYFFDWFETISCFEKLLCISETTKKSVENFMRVFFPKRLQKIKIESFLLGNEIPNTDISLGEPQEARIIRELLVKEQVFLMVGTLEPRKGHDELIDVLDIVWGKGEEVVIVFVGKVGWNVDGLIKKMKKHKLFGHRLIWLNACSDEFLLEMYSCATGLIVQSRAEGYSLPIVESQNFGLPVFARDIEVLREIARTYGNISFFKGEKPGDIADEFMDWKSRLPSGKDGKKQKSRTICWKKATKDLQKIIID